jgi:phage protein D
MANLRYAPEFKVQIDHAPIPAVLRASISSVTFQSGFDAVDRVELTLVNENLRWLDHPLLDMDKKLTLSLGYAPDPLTQVFVGEIVSQDASFPASGTPTLAVAAQDHRHRMQSARKARWFAIPIKSYGNIPMTDINVVDLISSENGLLPLMDPIGAALSVILGGVQAAATDVKDAEKVEKIIRKQITESDFEFLKKISLENGWDVLIDHSGDHGGYKLRFMSPLEHLTPDITLKYGQSLIDFTPRLSTVGQIAGVTATIWMSSVKKEFSITVSWNWDRQQLELGIDAGAGFGPPAKKKGAKDSDTPAGNKDQSGCSSSQIGETNAQSNQSKETSPVQTSWTLVDEPLTLANASRVILSKLIPMLNKRLTGSGSTVGDPQILPGKVLRLEGLGEKFGGLYRVTSATHTIDSGGYRTRFEVRKEIWFGSIPLPQQGAIPIQPPF